MEASLGTVAYPLCIPTKHFKWLVGRAFLAPCCTFFDTKAKDLIIATPELWGSISIACSFIHYLEPKCANNCMATVSSVRPIVVPALAIGCPNSRHFLQILFLLTNFFLGVRVCAVHTDKGVVRGAHERRGVSFGGSAK